MVQNTAYAADCDTILASQDKLTSVHSNLVFSRVLWNRFYYRKLVLKCLLLFLISGFDYEASRSIR